MRKWQVPALFIFSAAIAAAAVAGGQTPKQGAQAPKGAAKAETLKAVGKPARVKIATLDVKSGKVGSVSRELLADTFDDGMPITEVRVEKMGTRHYLIREGMSGKNHRISRTLLARDPKTGGLTVEVVATGTTAAMARPKWGATESCTGDPCSKCKFQGTGGGCSCASTTDPVGARCNHTISKLSVLMR